MSYSSDDAERAKANVPTAMQCATNWCCYKTQQRQDGSITKIPCNTQGIAIDGGSAKFAFDDVILPNPRVSGIGFALRSPFVGWDIDDCLVNGELVDDGIAADLEKINSYTEISPSGTGLHIIFLMNEKPEWVKRSRNGNYELYFNRRFFTFTGNVFGEKRSVRRVDPDDLKQIYEKVDPDFGKPAAVVVKEPAKKPVATSSPTMKSRLTGEALAKYKETFARMCGDLPPTTTSINPAASKFTLDVVGGTDAEVIDRLNTHSKSRMLFAGDWTSVTNSYGGSYPSQSEADLSLCRMIAEQTGFDYAQTDAIFRKSGLFREKWDRPAKDGYSYGDNTIMLAFKSAGHEKDIPGDQ